MWRDGWQKTREKLRLWLLEQELSDDARHARGRRAFDPSVLIQDTILIRSALQLPEPADLTFPTLPPVWMVPPEVLQEVRPELVWDVTEPLDLAVRHMRLEARRGLLVALDLADCQYSVHLTQALRETVDVWSPSHALLRLRPGGRLNKAWLRRLKLGDDILQLTSMPALLLFETHSPAASAPLHLRTLALDPMGPGRSRQKMKALLEGQAQLAPGAALEVLTISDALGQKEPLRLEQASHFRGEGQGWQLRGLLEP